MERYLVAVVTHRLPTGIDEIQRKRTSARLPVQAASVQVNGNDAY